MGNQTIDQSRRGFFTGALLTREGKDQVVKQIRRLGILPPGLELTVSNVNCKECEGYCSASCPQKIIRQHPQNHKLHGQPYLDFNINGCTFCDECSLACPSLLPEGNASRQPVLGKARIDQSKCHAWNGVICMSCSNACTDKLFKFQRDRTVSVEQEPCTGCGFCVNICPANAIAIQVE